MKQQRRGKDMAQNVGGQYKLSLDEWSVREKLVLACSVVRSGDQNWASVSRTIKPICDAVQTRPVDWFAQKCCANQYSALLEGTSTKKRKRTSSESGANETPMEQIIRKLSFERIDELKKAIQADRKKYKKLKNDIEKIRSGKVDDQLQKIWNDLRSGKGISIEAVIPEEVPEFQLALGTPYTDVPHSPFVSSNSSAQQQQQQQSSALYQRSKSQRQPKATKKFESWMTQLKQQQARHQQSHAGSLHASPHGQPSSTATSVGDSPLPADANIGQGVRPQSFYSQQFAQQSPYQQQQQHYQQEQLYMQQQQQIQQQLFKQQQQQPNQAQGYPQISPRHQMSVEGPAGVHGNTSEAGSVLSSLLSAPTSEIKAAAKMQQQKILEEHLAAKDASSTAANQKDESISDSHSSSTQASVLVTAPTLSRLLEPSYDQPSSGGQVHRRMSSASNDGQQEAEGKVFLQHSTVKHSLSSSSSQMTSSQLQTIKLSPSSQTKTTDSSPSDKTSKKSTPDSSRTTPVEPLRIKVEDEDYFPDNEGVATPDSSQPSPRARSRKSKGKRGSRRKHPQLMLLKNLESFQDSEDTCSVDELASERDETESEVASVSDAKDISDVEQEDVEEGGYHKMAEEAREHALMRRSRGRTSSSNLSGIVMSPNSPTLSVGSNDDNSQAQKNWRKSIMLVWKSIASHKYANVFMHPVTDDEAPGYHNIIKRPMDLSTIKKNIETGGIRSTNEFQRDIMLMFQNALMYNREDHDVHRMAEEMREEVIEQIQSFIATQLHLMVQSSDRDTMMLRGHRSDDEKVESRRTKSHGRATLKV